ncbi:MAG: HAD hydrolase-like protein [bacterium]|nr:HAD hydrolase-like protein [bacterium]
MVFVFDLDHTLLDTEKLLRSYVRDALRPYGVSWQIFKKALSKDKRLRSRRGCATPRTIFSSLSSITKRTYPISLQRQLLKYFRIHAHNFFYPDVFRILPTLHGKKILLTKGNRVIQASKLQHASVRSLFDRIQVTPHVKAGRLKRIVATFPPGERIIFIDDWHEEHKAALKVMPQLTSAHMIRRGRDRKRVAHRRCFMVQNLKQLKSLVISMSLPEYADKKHRN